MPVSEMYLPTNITSPNFTPFYENPTVLDKILGNFFKFSDSFPLPQMKRSVTNLIILLIDN